MESVEIWMWTIAGILLGTMIFVASYNMLSRYTYNAETGQALTSFRILKSVSERVCLGGMGSEEVKELAFPALTSRIYIIDQQGFEEQGKKLCIQLANGRKQCASLAFCTFTMPSVELQGKVGVYTLLDKALGRRKATKLRFQVSKTAPSDVRIVWTEVSLDAE